MADLLELSYPAPNGCAPPNGSRLSCGRLARWRKDGGRVRCSPGHDTTGSFRTSAPVSFKRLLDGPTVWGRVAILEVHIGNPLVSIVKLQQEPSLRFRAGALELTFVRSSSASLSIAPEANLGRGPDKSRREVVRIPAFGAFEGAAVCSGCPRSPDAARRQGEHRAEVRGNQLPEPLVRSGQSAEGVGNQFHQLGDVSARGRADVDHLESEVSVLGSRGGVGEGGP